MSTFAREPKTARQTTPARPPTAGRTRPAHSRDLHLQRTVGNRAVQRLAQNKATEHGAEEAKRTNLLINAPGDEYEQEADHVAEQVTRVPESSAQPLSAGRGGAGRVAAGTLLRRAHAPAPSPGSTRSQGAAHASPDAPRIVGDVVSESGGPLDPLVQSFMEPRLGHDFSDVRIHTGSRAAESARAVDAVAYTVGRHVVFDEGAYRPETDAGRRLIAHELTHVVQQAAAGPSVQRAPADGAGDAPPVDLDAIFDALEKEQKTPIRPKMRAKLREWAAEYTSKTGRAVDLDIIRGTWISVHFHQRLPEIKTAAEVEAERLKNEAKKLKPPVPCNEIIPYKVGTRLLVTHLLDKVLPPDKVETLKKYVGQNEEEPKEATGAKKPEEVKERGLEEIIRAHPTAVLDLIMSADVPKSATAVITKSGPELVEATVAVPAIPAKGSLPAYEAFTATMSLEFNTYRGDYDLRFTRETAGGQSTAFSISDLQISKTGESIQVSVGKDDYFKVRVAAGKDGNLKLQVFDINALARMLLGLTDQITLVNVAPTGEQLAEVKQKEKEVRSEYKAPPRTDRPALSAGTGLQWTDRPEALFSLGWRFTFSPDIGIVQVPLVFQLDYAPRADFFGEVYTGVKGRIPGTVPVTLTAIGGARVGTIETRGTEGEPGPRVNVGGPLGGLGVGVQLAPSVELQLDTSLMWNVFRYGTGQGPEVIPGVGVKTNLMF